MSIDRQDENCSLIRFGTRNEYKTNAIRLHAINAVFDPLEWVRPRHTFYHNEWIIFTITTDSYFSLFFIPNELK